MYKQILQLWAYFAISCTNPRLQSGEPKRHRDHTTQHAHASITWCPCESSTGKALFPRDKRFKYLAVRRRYSVEAVSATLLCPACLSADKAMPGSLRIDGAAGPQCALGKSSKTTVQYDPASALANGLDAKTGITYNNNTPQTGLDASAAQARARRTRILICAPRLALSAISATTAAGTTKPCQDRPSAPIVSNAARLN